MTTSEGVSRDGRSIGRSGARDGNLSHVLLQGKASILYLFELLHIPREGYDWWQVAFCSSTIPLPFSRTK